MSNIENAIKHALNEASNLQWEIKTTIKNDYLFTNLYNGDKDLYSILEGIIKQLKVDDYRILITVIPNDYSKLSLCNRVIVSAYWSCGGKVYGAVNEDLGWHYNQRNLK